MCSRKDADRLGSSTSVRRAGAFRVLPLLLLAVLLNFSDARSGCDSMIPSGEHSEEGLEICLDWDHNVGEPKWTIKSGSGGHSVVVPKNSPLRVDVARPDGQKTTEVEVRFVNEKGNPIRCLYTPRGRVKRECKTFKIIDSSSVELNLKKYQPDRKFGRKGLKFRLKVIDGTDSSVWGTSEPFTLADKR